MKSTTTFADGDRSGEDVLGAKGAGLCLMTQMRLPVPPGFIIAAPALRSAEPQATLVDEIRRRVGELERQTGSRFGLPPEPLLLSVRSGARVSMPGMMDTVLNVGMNRPTALRFAERDGLEFALDTYARFVLGYAGVIAGAGDAAENAVRATLAHSVRTRQAIATAIEAAARAARDALGDELPEDPLEQLMHAIDAVGKSWMSERARRYREAHAIRDHGGTAIVVQAMVFGNRPGLSGSGVLFTRDPRSGDPGLFGEFVSQRQGEDLVSGTATPQPLSSLTMRAPDVGSSLEQVAARLESHQRDMLDVEFTLESGELHLLQVRTAKRSAAATIRVSCDLAVEGVISTAEAIARVRPADVRTVMQPGLDDGAAECAVAGGAPAAGGIAASPGVATGRAVLDPDRALRMAGPGGERMALVLVRDTTSPRDLHGIMAARGVLTARGGVTSHAALVARSLNKPCVVACEGLEIDEEGRRFRLDGRWFGEGAPLTVDGGRGRVICAALPAGGRHDASDHLVGLLDLASPDALPHIFACVSHVGAVGPTLRVGASGVALAIDAGVARSEAATADLVGDVLAAAGQAPIILRLTSSTDMSLGLTALIEWVGSHRDSRRITVLVDRTVALRLGEHLRAVQLSGVHVGVMREPAHASEILLESWGWVDPSAADLASSGSVAGAWLPGPIDDERARAALEANAAAIVVAEQELLCARLAFARTTLTGRP